MKNRHLLVMFLVLFPLSLFLFSDTNHGTYLIEEINIYSEYEEQLPGRIQILHNGEYLFLPEDSSKEYILANILAAKANDKKVKIYYTTEGATKIITRIYYTNSN